MGSLSRVVAMVRQVESSLRSLTVNPPCGSVTSRQMVTWTARLAFV